MRDDLVPEKVEIDPFLRRAALRTAEQAAIKCACFAEIAHGEGEMETGPGHAGWFVEANCERSKACG